LLNWNSNASRRGALRSLGETHKKIKSSAKKF
jgi:hypothetical protein